MNHPARRRPRWLTVALLAALLAAGGLLPFAAGEDPPAPIALLGLGDSLTHGTMDATNNAINTANAYLQRVRGGLGLRVPVAFR